MANQISVDFKELAALLVRQNGIKEGHWGVWMRFGIAGSNAGPDADHLTPAALVPVQEIGIQRFDSPNNLTVDARKIWGVRDSAASPKKSAAVRKSAPKAKAKK
jgi:hypothetical protein